MLIMEKALYKITNLINLKVYIGQSIHPQKRWLEHCQHARAQDDNLPIHLAIKKYGKENFSFEILEWSENYNKREQELILQYNSLIPNGYNILDGSSNNPVMIGENHPRNTLSQNIIDQIFEELKENKISDIDIAKKFNTTPKIVSDINHGITHIKPNIKYPIRTRRGRTGGLPLETKYAIIEDLKNTKLSYQNIADKYNVSKGLIGHMNYGRYEKLPNVQYPVRGRM